MERLTVQQRRVVAILALIIAALSFAYFIYWVAIIENHPWLKHSLLFAILAVGGLAFAAYAWPRTSRTE